MAIEPSELPQGPLLDLYDYWTGLRKSDALPVWDDIQLADMGTLVPQITVFDIDLKKRDAYIRFVGTKIIESQGGDTTGARLSEMDNMTRVLDRCLAVAETHDPYFIADQPIVWTHKNFKTYSTLGLPLADAEGEVNKVIYLMVFA